MRITKEILDYILKKNMCFEVYAKKNRSKSDSLKTIRPELNSKIVSKIGESSVYNSHVRKSISEATHFNKVLESEIMMNKMSLVEKQEKGFNQSSANHNEITFKKNTNNDVVSVGGNKTKKDKKGKKGNAFLRFFGIK